MHVLQEVGNLAARLLVGFFVREGNFSVRIKRCQTSNGDREVDILSSSTCLCVHAQRIDTRSLGGS